ncbi:unnamed protein product [Jaminaea pallidilutea]
MAPKIDPNDPEVKRITERFAQISYTGPKALETVKNAKHVKAIEDAIERHNLSDAQIDPRKGQLIVMAATQSPASFDDQRRGFLITKTIEGELDSEDRVKTAIKWLEGVASINEAEFRDVCGVGVVVTPAEIEQLAAKWVSEHKSEIEAKGKPNIGSILQPLRQIPELRWANALDLKNAAEKQLKETTWDVPAAAGPSSSKSKAGATAATPTKAGESSKSGASAASADLFDPDAMFKEGFLSRLHAPGENPQVSDALKRWHLDATKGRVFTRFPPEPNGYLHIGHTKAIAIDFGFARFHKGLCYLRFDDTNPEAEEGVYFDSILETVRWLGYEPWKITYSSDYFQQLYETAIALIKRGKAYVDHSTPAEIKAERGGEERGPRKASQWRDRPVEDSLRDFEDMKNGKYQKGTATLRMKQDILGNGNPQMWDLIAYRVVDSHHHRTGDRWKIYPTYDFTHCLVDSFENISHSLCTTEFVLSRESYEWLCDAVEVYKPRQYEFGRLNLEGTITSKRKIKALVEGGHVKDWDDPRLFTVIAIRRRGVPPGAILAFVNQLGVSTAVTQITANRFDQTIRQYLESSTPRLMMVLNPVTVVLENVPDDWSLTIEKPLHPKVPAWGKNTVPLTKKVYLDASDFRTEDSPDYFRLAPGKSVGLFQAPFPITCTGYEQDESGGVKLVRARYEDPSMGGQALDKAQLKKLAYIHWVADSPAAGSPVRIDEARIFHPLFNVENPAGESNFLDHVNKDSLEVHKDALIEVGFWDVAKYSLERAKEEAVQRTQKAAEERRAMMAEGGDVIRTPPGTTPLQSHKVGEGAPDADDPAALIGPETIRLQAMRTAYFAVDRETTMDLQQGSGSSRQGKLILNRIVSLKAAVEATAGSGGQKGSK